MLSFISAKEVSKKWGISQRRVAKLCSENRIEGAMMVGNMWIIPSNAQKPEDARVTNNENGANKSVKPFVKWVGGKSQLVEKLEEQLLLDNREYTSYVEPMVGGGALLFHIITKYKFEKAYICDINAELMNCYKVVRDNVIELIERLNEMQLTFLPMAESGRKYYYYSIRDKFNNLPLNDGTAVEKASYFTFLNKTCFNGLYRVNKKGQFNVPMGSYQNPMICDEDNLKNVSALLKNVEIFCGDYSIVEKFIDEKSFVYIDPPYRPISKSSSFTSYNSDSFDDKEQIRLSEFFTRISQKGAKVVLSNSDPKNCNEEDNFFDDLYSNFNIERIEASRSINSKGDNRGKIKELLIKN